MGRGLVTVGVMSAVVVSGSVVVAPGAHARQYDTLTFIRWGGPSYCLWVTSPTVGNMWSTSTDYVCKDNRQIVVGTPALSSQYVGANPIITPGVSWAGCSVVVNGQLDFADHALAGDGTDVNCLRVLN